MTLFLFDSHSWRHYRSLYIMTYMWCSFSGGGVCYKLSCLGPTKVSLSETILIQALLDKPVVKLIGTDLYFTFSWTYSLSMGVEQAFK